MGDYSKLIHILKGLSDDKIPLIIGILDTYNIKLLTDIINNIGIKPERIIKSIFQKVHEIIKTGNLVDLAALIYNLSKLDIEETKKSSRE